MAVSSCELAAFVFIAYITENLQVTRLVHELGIQRPRFDVVRGKRARFDRVLVTPVSGAHPTVRRYPFVDEGAA